MKQVEKIKLGLFLLFVALLTTFAAAAQEIVKEYQAEGNYLFINVMVKNNQGNTNLVIAELNSKGEDTVLVHQINKKFVTIKLSLNQEYEITFLNQGKEKHMYVFNSEYKLNTYWVYLDLDWKLDTDICSVVYEEKVGEFEVIVPMAGKSKK